MVEGVKEYLKNADWRKQHGWRRALWMTMSRFGLTGAHALPMNRRWVEIHRRKMPLINLDPNCAGLRMVQLSVLHYSPVVWQRYLVQHIVWVNEMKPDVVVVTGDLITGGYRFAHRIATILSHLHTKHGVICTFGNHDYSIYGRNGSNRQLLADSTYDFIQLPTNGYTANGPVWRNSGLSNSSLKRLLETMAPPSTLPCPSICFVPE